MTGISMSDSLWNWQIMGFWNSCIYTYSTIYSNLRLSLYSLLFSHSILYTVLFHLLTMHCYTFKRELSLKHFVCKYINVIPGALNSQTIYTEAVHSLKHFVCKYSRGCSASKWLLTHLPACVGNTHRTIHTVHALYYNLLRWIYSNISTIRCLPARYLFSLLCD
jgi:hypothetical protein